MPRKRYCVVNESIATLLGSLGYPASTLGGYYAYEPGVFASASNAVLNEINRLLDDTDPENDSQAYAMQDIMESDYTELYWSTEGKFWYFT